MGKLITISTNKGGAGKTTLATNIACAISNLKPNSNICIVDLDPQCGVSITFGKAPNKYAGKSILSIINKTSKLSDTIINDIKNGLNEPKPNLYFIPSEPNLQSFDHQVNQNLELKNNLAKTFQFLKKQFDYVIVDTPPAISTVNIITYLESDLIISPFEPERQNIEGSLKIVNEIKKSMYKIKPWIYLLPIKVRERTIIDRELLIYITDIIALESENNNKILLSEIKIPNSTQYKSTTAKEKVPLIDSKAKSKAVAAQKELINQLTVELLEILDK